jgi:hypothetical protein
MELSNDQTQYEFAPRGNVWQQGRPSPVADLIDKHRAEMGRIWQRHVAELRKPPTPRSAVNDWKSEGAQSAD